MLWDYLFQLYGGEVKIMDLYTESIYLKMLKRPLLVAIIIHHFLLTYDGGPWVASLPGRGTLVMKWLKTPGCLLKRGNKPTLCMTWRTLTFVLPTSTMPFDICHVLVAAK
jgi:hypothetical protein